MSRQISHGVDHAHHLDAVFKRLIEHEPTLVLEIQLAFGHFGISVTDVPPVRLLVYAIADLEIDSLPHGGVSVDE